MSMLSCGSQVGLRSPYATPASTATPRCAGAPTGWLRPSTLSRTHILGAAQKRLRLLGLWRLSFANGAALVKSLLFSRGPSAVSWLIVPVHVYAVNREPRRGLAHVC